MKNFHWGTDFKKIVAIYLLFCFSFVGFAQDCYESSIVSPSPFMGNDSEIFKLADGTLWEVKYEYEYLYAYSPDVVICPSRGKLAVEGKTLNVAQIGKSREAPRKGNQKSKPLPQSIPTPDLVESQIEGEFSGWDGETIFKLTNGQIWQQSSYAYTYSYKYRPTVMIFRSAGGYQLQVEGMTDRISVIRIK
jgi:hypothetical protein